MSSLVESLYRYRCWYICLCIYISNQIPDRRSIALRMRREWNQSGPSGGAGTRGRTFHPRPEAGSTHLVTHLTTVEAGGPDGATALSGSPASRAQMRAGGRQQIRMTGIFHPVLLWPHVPSCRLWYITFPKMESIRMERERICRNVYLSTAHEFSPLWIERLTPRNENRDEETWWHSPVQGTWLPPQGHLVLDLSTRSSQLNNPMKALVCCVPSLYGFCNKKC